MASISTATEISVASDATAAAAPAKRVVKSAVPSLKAEDVKKILVEAPTDTEFMSNLKEAILADSSFLSSLAEKLAALLPAQAPVSAPASVSSRGRGRPKKEAPPPMAMPETDGSAPTAEDYRLKEEEIKTDACVGRIISEKQKDERWSIAVYREAQCGAEICDAGGEDNDLCLKCLEHADRYAADRAYRKWCGKVTEEPPGWLHMLGTPWAAQAIEGGKLRWIPGSDVPAGGAGDSASVVSADSAGSGQMSTGTKKTIAELKAEEKLRKAAQKEADKKAKEAQKEADRKAKEEAKATEKKAKEEAKAAEKAAKAALKDAEKAKKAAEREAAKAAKTTTTTVKKTTVAASVPAKAAPAPVKTTGSVMVIDGETYFVEGHNVYEYDTSADSKGAFVGALGKDRESIDNTVEEPVPLETAPVAVKTTKKAPPAKTAVAAPVKTAAAPKATETKAKTGGGSAAAPPADDPHTDDDDDDEKDDDENEDDIDFDAIGTEEDLQ